MLGLARNCLFLRGRNVLLKRYSVRQVTYNSRSNWDTVSSKNQDTLEDKLESEDDRPIKYSTSKAATMRIDEYHNPYPDLFPWYQDYVIILSLVVFLIYFCILREENDIDEELYIPLQERLDKTKLALEKERKT